LAHVIWMPPVFCSKKKKWMCVWPVARKNHVGKNIMTWFLGILIFAVSCLLHDGQELQVSKSIVNTWSRHISFLHIIFFFFCFCGKQLWNWFWCVFYLIVMIIWPLQSWLNFWLMTAEWFHCNCLEFACFDEWDRQKKEFKRFLIYGIIILKSSLV